MSYTHEGLCSSHEVNEFYRNLNKFIESSERGNKYFEEGLDSLLEDFQLIGQEHHFEKAYYNLVKKIDKLLTSMSTDPLVGVKTYIELNLWFALNKHWIQSVYVFTNKFNEKVWIPFQKQRDMSI